MQEGKEVQGRGKRKRKGCKDFKGIRGKGCRSKEGGAGKGGSQVRPPSKVAHQKGFGCENVLITFNVLKPRLKMSRAFPQVGAGSESTPCTPISSWFFLWDSCEAKAGLCSKLKF